MMLRKIIGLTLYALLGSSSLATAQINVNSNIAYTENFDGMGASTTLPANWRMAINTPTPTWAAGLDTVDFQASSGSPTTGGTYNWGQNGATERAVGAMTSGSFSSPNSLMAWYRNTNVWPITQLTVSYNAERYRINTAAASIQFYYSLDGTNWIAVTAGDIAAASFPTGSSSYTFTSPLVVNVGAFNITGITLAPNSFFYLRWNINTTGTNSQGIGIDDVSVTPSFATLPTNIVDGGVNWVGVNQGYAQPINCNGASPFVMKYRRVATTTSNPSDGRGQWFTTLNAQPSGGDVTTQNMGGGSNNGFLFTNGGNCGETGNYSHKWVFSNAGSGALDQINENIYTSGGADMGLNMSDPGYYSFAFRDAGYANSSFYVGYTSSAPVSFLNSTATLNHDYSVTVNATLSANPSAQERFYIRYRVGSNDFTSGTSIVEGSGSGSSRTFIIPSQTIGTTIYYYLFSSTLSLTALNGLSEGDRSLACLQYLDNNNNNFSFTIPAPTTYTWNATGTASWTTASNWSPNGVPANGDNVVFSNATAVTVTNVPNISLRSLVLSGAGQVNWQSSQAVVVNIGFTGVTNPAMTLASSKVLNFNSATPNSIRLNIRNGFTARIDGRIEFRSAAHRLTGEAANAVSFENGSYFLAGTGFTGNAFGSTSTAMGVNGSVLFQNGATYENSAGANPFGDAGDARVVFYAGSLYLHNSSNFPSFSGRTYANVRFTSAAGSMPNLTGSSAYSIDNLELENNVTLGLNLTGTGSIRGNIMIGTGSTLSFNPSSATTIQINGTSPQSLTGPGTLTLGDNATMSVLSGRTFNLGTNVISGAGTFVVQAGATLGIGSPDGITTSPTASGNVRTTTRTFSTGGNYVYNGASNQTTGNALPTTVNNLGINNTGTAPNNVVTLTNNNTSTNALILSSGLFAAGVGQTLRINAGGTVAGTGGHVSTNINGEGGTIEFLGSGSVTGTPNLWIVAIGNSGTGVSFTNNAPIYHQCIIGSGGFVTNAPTYQNGSTLIYRTGGTYARNVEWGNTAGLPGYPHHVTVDGNTIVDLNTNNISPDTLAIGGNLQLGSSNGYGRMYLNNNMNKPLEVRGHLTIGVANPVPTNNELALSNAIGGDLILHGNFTRYNGSFYNDNGRAIFFRGAGNTIINVPGIPAPSPTSTDPTLQDFSYAIVDKTVNTAKVTLNVPVGVTEKLTLTKGIVDATAQGLFIKQPAPDAPNIGIQGGSADSYIDGKLYRYTSGSTTGNYWFPIGNSAGGYRPLRFTNTNTGGDRFVAEYFKGATVTPSAGQDIFQAELTGIQANEYWQFDRLGSQNTTGRVALMYRLAGATWRNANGDPLTPVGGEYNVAIVKRTDDTGPGSWSYTKPPYTFNTATPDFEARLYSDDGLIVTGDLSSFSPFTFGFSYSPVLGSLPVKLLSFEGALQGADARLQWRIDSDKDLRHFELQYSTDGSQFSTLATVVPAGRQYQYLHRGLAAGKHYYRLRVMEKDGQQFYSKTVLLSRSAGATYVVGLQQNPVGTSLALNLWSASAQAAEYSLTDMGGRQLLRRRSQLLPGANQLRMPVAQLPAGVYHLTVLTADGVQQTLRVLKQ
jgi:hypothetical protein